MFSLIGIRFRGGKWFNTDGLWGNKTFIRRLTNTMDGQTERQQLGQGVSEEINRAHLVIVEIWSYKWGSSQQDAAGRLAGIHEECLTGSLPVSMRRA